MSENSQTFLTIFNLEKDAMEKLITFNKTYQRYLCKTDTYNAIYKNKCSDFKNTNTSDDDLSRAFNSAQISISNLKTAIENTSNSNYVNKTDYATNYDTIMSTYKDIVKKRQELDSSLTELYEIGDTAGNFYQKKLISTSYTKILLTIIATSLTVAAFMTMRNKS
jgi:hypothetical protein